MPTAEQSLSLLGQRLAAHRRLRGLTREELASAAGIGISSLVRLESGESGVSIGILLKVLKALGFDGHMNALAFLPENLMTQPGQHSPGGKTPAKKRR